MAKTGAIELIEYECRSGVRIEFWDYNGVGDSRFDIFIDAQADIGKQRGLANEDEVVIFWEVLEEQAQFAKTIDLHEMGVIDNGSDHPAKMLTCYGLRSDMAEKKVSQEGSKYYSREAL